MAKLLNTVSDGANEQISAHPWRLAAMKPPPLFAQFVKAESGKSLKDLRHIHVARRPTGCFAFGQTSFRHGSAAVVAMR
jgi:hypothetical protein